MSCILCDQKTSYYGHCDRCGREYCDDHRHWVNVDWGDCDKCKPELDDGLCEACRGSGAGYYLYANEDDGPFKCSACNGTGKS